MGSTIYLDHAATSPMRPEVWEAMAPFAMDVFGNASGSHEVSRRAKNSLEEARERVASELGCRPGEVVFTGGGTESDNLAIKGVGPAGNGHVITSMIEHEAVTESVRRHVQMGGTASWIGVDTDGLIHADEVAESIGPETVLVSVMYANNETGAIQPIRRIVEQVDGRVPVHTDAVQAFATEGVRVNELGVDLLSLAAHKFGGPKGVGVLYVRDGIAIRPLLDGGGHELGRRSGTANVMGAVGMATAMERASACRAIERATIDQARETFEKMLADVAVRTVPADSSLVSHAHLRFPGCRNETMLVRLDRHGVGVSVGSACASGAATVSPVLRAMGLEDEDARSSLRFSFGWTSTVDESVDAAQIVRRCLS